MGTITITPAPTAADSAEARSHVDAQLRAYRVHDRPLRARLTTEILEEAERIQAVEPDRSFAELAAEAAHNRLVSWIDTLLGPSEESAAVRFARGRTAIHLANLPDNWPALMLNLAQVPEELLARVRAINLEAGPTLTFANMAPRPIDLGPISTVADGTWRTFDRWPVLRGGIIAALFFSLLGTAFYLVRF